MEEYQQMIGHYSGHSGWFSSHSTTTLDFYGQYFEEDRSMALMFQKLIWHSVAVFPGSAKPTEDFQMSVAILPTAYDNATYQDFIQEYGTHYMSKGYMGGMGLLTQYFTSCFLEQYSGQYVYKQSSSSFFGIFNKHDGHKYGHNTTDGRYVEFSESSVKMYGGFADKYAPFNWTNPVGEKTLQEWRDNIKFSMMPVSFYLEPVYTLISDPTKQANVKRAIMEYGASVNASNIALVNKLKPKDPHKVPDWCKFNPHPPMTEAGTASTLVTPESGYGADPMPSCPSLPSSSELSAQRVVRDRVRAGLKQKQQAQME